MKKWIVPVLLLLSACSPNEETRGYMRDPDWKDQVRVGETTRDKVQEVLGSPSVKSTYGDDAWYYITTRRESFAFLKPKVTDQTVTRITFDSAGVVTAIDEFDEMPKEDFAYVKRTTPTEGHKMTVMEQLVGNLGRFNKPGSTTGPVAGSPSHGRPGQGPGR